MSRPSTEDLLAKLKTAGPSDVPVLTGRATVQAWVQRFHVRAGRYIALEATDLYRHYATWCAGQGHEPMTAPHMLRVMGEAVQAYKTRTKRGGRDTRPYKLDADSAAFFKKWLKYNPRGPADTLRSSNGVDIEAELERLGVST